MSEEQGSYIQQVHLKGYKSVKDLTVSFQKGLNIIIGANGSGKTNFMEFLDAAFNSNLERLLNNRKFVVEILGSSFKIKIESEIDDDFSNKNNYKFKIVEEWKHIDREFTKFYLFNENETVIFTEDVNEADGEFFVPLDTNKTLYLSFDNPLSQILKEKFGFMLYKWTHTTVLEGDTEFDIITIAGKLSLDNTKNTFLNHIFYLDRVIIIDSTLENIISEIIKDEWIKSESLKSNLAQFSPIKDFKIDWSLTQYSLKEEKEGENAKIEGIDFQFFVNNEWINWTQLSNVTKRLFYLIGSVTYAKENEIILMEEPELGVHPHQLTLLMNFLKAESKTKQIIISTHSPQVLNCLKEDELDHIIVARHEGKAGTQMYHLSEEEKGYATEYMKNQAFLSDYWLQSGFMNEETVDSK